MANADISFGSLVDNIWVNIFVDFFGDVRRVPADFLHANIRRRVDHVKILGHSDLGSRESICASRGSGYDGRSQNPQLN